MLSMWINIYSFKNEKPFIFLSRKQHLYQLLQFFNFEPFFFSFGQDVYKKLSSQDVKVYKNDCVFFYRAAIKRGGELIKDHGGGDLPVDKYEFYSNML